MIPTEIKSLPIWAVRKEKVPHHPSGVRASSTDPASWVTYDEAQNALQSGEFDGIGIFLNPSPQPFGIFCVDLDHMRDRATGVLHPVAEEIVKRLDTFTEVSQSGTGIHIFGTFREVDFPHTKVKLDDERAIEMYTKSRFIAVTESVLPGANSNFEDRTDELTAIYEKYIAPHFKNPEHSSLPVPIGDHDINVGERLELAYRSKSGAAIRALMAGDLTGYQQDESAADLALCMHLAFWFERRADLIEEAFGRSVLGNRLKWRTRADYRQRTIETAIRGTKEVYERKRKQELSLMTQEPDTYVPAGFTLTAEGVFFQPPPIMKNGQTEQQDPVKVCSPLRIEAATFEKVESVDWGLYLTWEDRAGRKHAWAMPGTLHAGDGLAVREELIRGGVRMSSHPQSRALLNRYLAEAEPPGLIHCVNQVGWYDGVYVLPDRVIGQASERVVLQSPIYIKSFGQAGTLDEWKTQVAALCVGNTRLVLAVSISFASVLAGLIDFETGGVHFTGLSSSGKTTALLVAGSTWGAPDSYMTSWRATSNGLEIKAATHNDGLLILDEIGQSDAKTVGDVAYMLANGQGKIRMSRSGAVRHQHRFRLMWISSGEKTLSAHMRTADQKIKGGQEVRCLNISAQRKFGIFDTLHGESDGADFAMLLKERCRQYHGTAIPAFLEEIARKRSGAVKALQAGISHFVKLYLPKDASGEVFRACQRFALIASAGMLATTYGVTGWNPREPWEAAKACFDDWLAERGTVGASDVDNGKKQLRMFLEKYGESRFQSINDDPSDGPMIHQRAGFKGVDKGETEYYILPEVFKTEVMAGYDYRAIADALADEGIILKSRDRVTTKKRVPGLGQIWVYTVTAKIFESDGADDHSVFDALFE